MCFYCFLLCYLLSAVSGKRKRGETVEPSVKLSSETLKVRYFDVDLQPQGAASSSRGLAYVYELEKEVSYEAIYGLVGKPASPKVASTTHEVVCNVQ